LRAPLVVTAFSRFARNVRDALDLSERLDRAGAGLVSLSEQVDTSTAQGRFSLKLMASLAEMEAETVAERTKSAMQHLRAQGRSLGSRPPFGWDASTSRSRRSSSRWANGGVPAQPGLRWLHG
jgi:DNA invertase Pin-like site-specific DNA recombinase